MQKITRDNAIEKVKLFTTALLQQHLPIEKVLLFGSYAKNEQTDYSDIDVVIVSPLFSGFGFNDRKHFASINNKKEFIDIETKTYSKNHFEERDPFIDEILKTSVLIYTA